MRSRQEIPSGAALLLSLPLSISSVFNHPAGKENSSQIHHTTAATSHRHRKLATHHTAALVH
jgi:hypothetical protein